MIKIAKYILSITFIATLFTTAMPNAYAVTASGSNLVLTCNDTDCVLTPSSPSTMFNETNWYPGDTVSRSITVYNNKTDECSLKIKTENETAEPATYPEKLFTTIVNAGTNTEIYGLKDGTTKASSSKKLSNLFAETENLKLGNLPRGSATVFDWIVTFDPTTGNEYQGADLFMDFDLKFSCNPDRTVNDDNGGGGGGGSSDGGSNEDNGSDNSTGNTSSGGTGSPSSASASTGGGTVLGISDTQEATESTSAAISDGKKPTIEDILSNTQEQVAGTTDECTDSIWWVLLLIAQAALMLIIYVASSKIKTVLYALVVAAVAFGITFFLYFCTQWDLVISLIISGIGLLGIYFFDRE